MRFRNSSTGPDEFLVVPANPLQTPPETGALPPPTLGQANRADATPRQDAVAALGGNPAALDRGGVPAADGALLATTARYGRDPVIRSTLASEDLEFRSRNNGRFLERVFGVNTYYSAYEREALDQQGETGRLRRSGVPTPAAPPPELFPE